jgi:HK97 gp10 family phage protein
MAGVSVRIYRANLQALLEGPRGPVARDLARRAERVRSRAAALAPVDTGRLRSSITWRIVFRGGVAAVVSAPVHYAIYQELGTRYMRAQPFLVPALEAAA